MARDISVAPKERVNITYQANSNGTKKDVELPNKILVVGDFTHREEDEEVVDRKAISVDKNNFQNVMEKQNLSLNFMVANKLSSENGDDLNVELSFRNMKDFEPESVVNQIPELKKLLELREALAFLKGPMGNIAAFRKQIDALLSDSDSRQKLMNELGINE